MSQDRSNTGTRKSRTFLRLLAGASVLVPGVVHAQAAPPPEPSVTDAQNADTPQTTKTSSGDIIVVAKHYVPQGAETATKSDIPLIQTPQSVSVITRDQMDLLELHRRAAGRRAIRPASPARITVPIRASTSSPCAALRRANISTASRFQRRRRSRRPVSTSMPFSRWRSSKARRPCFTAQRPRAASSTRSAAVHQRVRRRGAGQGRHAQLLRGGDDR